MIKHIPLEGLIAAPHTPFHEDRSLNLKMIEAQAQSLVANRVTGAFVCGTTGEGLSLTIAERIQVAERWRTVAPKNLRVIVHVGHVGLDDCRALATNAQQIGADAIACLAPCFFKPGSVEDLVQFCAEVATAAPELPFYYYQIPSMTGVNFNVADFLIAASGRIPNLVGIKFTHENLMDFLQCLHLENGRFDMVFGRDEVMLGGLATGARAAIGSTYNFAAPIYHRLMAAFAKGDLVTARKEQLRSVELIQLLASYGFMGAAKATMKMIGVDVGPARLPNRTLTKEQASKLQAELERLGYFEWLKAG
ncbi:MAG: Dihydrodipicolinate synthetase [Verrucomicrobiales bacterium]|nr:Dihydrodipicolinate synthetase [Verrucomicrobiales bacterium]